MHAKKAAMASGTDVDFSAPSIANLRGDSNSQSAGSKRAMSRKGTLNGAKVGGRSGVG